MSFPTVCPICKTPWPSLHSLCDYCLSHLLRLREPIVRRDSRLIARSLFAWREDGPRAIDWLVRSLKGQCGAVSWLELTAWLLNFHPLTPGSVLVPIPSQAPRNHALGMARALSVWTGYPVVEALNLISRREQKRLGRQLRKTVQFELKQVGICREYTNVVIVDDIITSGATSRAAYQSLGQPKNCEVLCLFDRRPCGA